MKVCSNSLSDGYGSVQGLPVGQNTFAEVAIDELDNIRLREVTGKAISGSLLLLLKWFKRSRKTDFRDFTLQLLILFRYSEVRVHDAAVARFQLPAIGPEDVRSSRYRSSGRAEERP